VDQYLSGVLYQCFQLLAGVARLHIAQLLLQGLGKQRTNSWINGPDTMQKKIRAFAKKTRRPVPNFSFYNRISANHLVMMLQIACQSEGVEMCYYECSGS
jgi:hypothetical protein